MPIDTRTLSNVTSTVRHGVPHVVLPAVGPVRARMLFRVGMADETVPDRGLTHLVEHLVMRSVGRRPIEVDAHTGAWTTGFEATGRAEDVTRFLEEVWVTLADLPLDALDRERTILGHEASGRQTSPGVESVHHRYGVTGAGRLWTDELGLAAATPERVRAWVAERFTRASAALASTADLTPDLSAELGTGGPHPLPVPAPARDAGGPVWVGDAGGTAVSMLLPTTNGVDLAVGRLLLDLAEDSVRHDRALAYEVGMDCVPVTPTLTEVAVYVGCEPEDQAEVATLLVDAVRRLRDAGPTEEELALDRRRSLGVWTDTPDALEMAAEWATDLLVGVTPRSVADRVEQARTLNAGRVRSAVHGAWASLQVLLPDEVDPGIPDLAECRHDSPPVTGRRHRGNPLAGLLPGARMPLPLSASLTCGANGLTLRFDESVQTVPWDQVAAVVRQPDAFTVLGNDGTTILVPDGTFLRGGAVRREVEARVDPDLFVDAVA